MTYQVQTYTLLHGWINTWTEDDQPMTFETFQDAENELKEYLGELAHAVQFGMADFNPEDYRIVEGDIMTIHLTETGFNAGRRLCLTDRADGSANVHAAYAPINKPEYRVNCCPECLKVWAAEAYDDNDDMPTWVKQLRDELKTVGSLRLNDSGE